MDENKFYVFDELFNSIGNVLEDDNSDGLQVIAAILATPDEQFEAVKPALFDSIANAFNTPEARISFAQMINQRGLKIEDFTDNLDNLVQAISDFTVEDTEISDSKKDFLKFIFTTFINTINESEKVSHRIISIPIELCREDAKLPTYATNGSAAMDIYSPKEYTVGPNESIMIPTGLKVNIPKGYALLIQPRSGLSRKTKFRIPNSPGLVDSDYHEEIGVLIENIDAPIKQIGMEIIDGEIHDGTQFGSSFTIGKGERFAQMRLIEVPLVNWLPVSSIGNFENNHGEGFGSTGTN